ncbi:MAG: SDR family NAD(P)-dependent oxidoreductase [Candidatus Pacebacteria bacterium]|nr:SDR family NAD(P)-dependent oxidoreductase [Candidatus Paceibacterota bacterium]
MKLENKVAIVTGASSGLGLAMAKKFLEEGAKVVFSDINEEKGQEIVSKLENAIFAKCNVTKSEEVNNLINKAVEEFGSLDIMVNNAGTACLGTVDVLSDNDWQRVIDVNLTGVFYGVRAAAKYMKEKNIKGSIISTSSILGINGFVGAISYCAAKGGVNQITRTAAMELASCGIRVNAVAPGFIGTEMTRGILEDEKTKQFLEASTPLGRIGEPEDIANAALYLASDDSKYVTGSILYVDGGWTAR